MKVVSSSNKNRLFTRLSNSRRLILKTCDDPLQRLSLNCQSMYDKNDKNDIAIHWNISLDRIFEQRQVKRRLVASATIEDLRDHVFISPQRLNNSAYIPVKE